MWGFQKFIVRTCFNHAPFPEAETILTYFATILSFVITTKKAIERWNFFLKSVLLLKRFSFVTKTSNKKNINSNKSTFRTTSACTYARYQK